MDPRVYEDPVEDEDDINDYEEEVNEDAWDEDEDTPEKARKVSLNLDESYIDYWEPRHAIREFIQNW